MNMLNDIQQHKVPMRPKWHFVATTIAHILCGIMLALAMLVLMSFIFFVLRHTGAWFAPSLGHQGWYIVLGALPWLLVLAFLVFVIILELLLRRFSFAYRKPLLYSGIGIVLLAMVGGTLVERTHVHRRMLMAAQKNRLPFAGKIYRNVGAQRLPMMHPGTVRELIPSGFLLDTRHRETLHPPPP